MSQLQTLPEELPLFPLGGAILPPGELLPLNVFEPRYLNMLDDVRAGDGVIGIIQTLPGAEGETPALRAIGGAGRLRNFHETEDGRYIITLAGVSRFRLVEELDRRTPYRVGRADYREFAMDRAPVEDFSPDRERFIQLLKAWFAEEQVDADWTSIEGAPIRNVVNQLAMGAPFASAERQDLLEAADLPERFALMEELVAGRLIDRAEGGPLQ